MKPTVWPMVSVLCLWAAWFISWIAARAWSKSTLARPARRAERLYMVIAYGGFVLLFGAIAHTALFPKLLTLPTVVQWACVALAAAGFAFCWWARLHLADNWSWEVTRKDHHQIIDTGPYRFVRHPIYVGLIVASLATAVLIGKAPSLLAAALIVLGFWLKARLEERFLTIQLGAQAYADYARRTGMLLPKF
jgi:protein-S-isoprenylcysteine O-methyltransferase Ste14